MATVAPPLSSTDGSIAGKVDLLPIRTLWRILQYAYRVATETTFRSASHGIRNPISISTFGSDWLQCDKLRGLIGVELEHFRLQTLQAVRCGLYNELYLTIYDDLFLPIVHRLDPLYDVHAGGQALPNQGCGQVGSNLF